MSVVMSGIGGLSNPGITFMGIMPFLLDPHSLETL